ncbi:Mut7-C RNAse domain-containing protein, partial [Halorubrum tibetense]
GVFGLQPTVVRIGVVGFTPAVNSGILALKKDRDANGDGDGGDDANGDSDGGDDANGDSDGGGDANGDEHSRGDATPGVDRPDYVPDPGPESPDRFWRCRECGQWFWKGGHWESVGERLRAL